MKTERELKNLLSRNPSPPFHFACLEKTIEDWWEGYIKKLREQSGILSIFHKRQKIDFLRIEEIRIQLGITVRDLSHMWYEIECERRDQSEEYKKKPTKEGRDNKGVYVGSGGYTNRNKVRYPSKKRSRKTWKIFYQMFPRLAERDGWDGKSSKAMK